MFTYGYIREATMAHLDIDEEEAQAMNLLSRFYIFANEAMQAICASKPMYKYFTYTIVKDYEKISGMSDEYLEEYWNKQGVYKVGSVVRMPFYFLAFAEKRAFKIVDVKPNYEDLLFIDESMIKKPTKIAMDIEVDEDLSYIGQNQIAFHREGEYYIPARCLWYVFESGMSDEDELDMPADILLTIPLYVAALCLQVDNPQKASIKRSEFELALSRCTATDFMPLNKVTSSW